MIMGKAGEYLSWYGMNAQGRLQWNWPSEFLNGFSFIPILIRSLPTPMKNETAGALLTIWVIWFALMTVVFVMYFVAGPAQAGAGAGDFAWFIPLPVVAVATFIRWALLPRARGFPALMQLFIIGIAFSEGTCVMGLFAFPAHVETLFPLGVVSMLQFVPFYARRQIEGE
jgi:hypothetical protein